MCSMWGAHQAVGAAGHFGRRKDAVGIGLAFELRAESTPRRKARFAVTGSVTKCCAVTALRAR